MLLNVIKFQLLPIYIGYLKILPIGISTIRPSSVVTLTLQHYDTSVGVASLQH